MSYGKSNLQLAAMKLDHEEIVKSSLRTNVKFLPFSKFRKLSNLSKSSMNINQNEILYILMAEEKTLTKISLVHTSVM